MDSGRVQLPRSRSPLSARAFGSRLLLGDLIGRGGMSRVYRGWLRGSGQEVAVKVLRDDLATRPEAVQQFVFERDVLRAVASPHVVRVHDLVVDGDELGIVMDLIPGGHLRRAVTFPTTPAQAAQLAAQIADGLAAVHTAGVVHRDLKPENVLVDAADDGSLRLRITDFGISRLVDPARVTQTTVTGTPGYLAPEVATGARAGAEADIYALGVILYELCTGEGPFVADNAIVLVLAHTRQPLLRPGGMPDPLWTLVAGMLAKRPHDRPVAAQVAATLRGLRSELAGLPPCTPPIRPTNVDLGEPEPVVDPSRLVEPAPAPAPLPPSPRQPASARLEIPAAGQPGRALARHRYRSPPPAQPARRRVLVPVTAGLLVALAAGLGVSRIAVHEDAGPGTVAAGGASASSRVRPSPTRRTGAAGPFPGVRHTVEPVSQTGRTPTDSGSPGIRPAVSPSAAAASLVLAPAVPTLTLVSPRTGQRRPAAGVTLLIGNVKANAGTVRSITVRFPGGSQEVAVRPDNPSSYRTTVTGLADGSPGPFTAQVCNSAGRCSTSATLQVTPSATLVVQPPHESVSGRTVSVVWDPVLVDDLGNGNDLGGTVCGIRVVGTPADPADPQRSAAPQGGGLTFTGRTGTSYVATETCSTEAGPDVAASSAPVVVAG